MGQEPGQVKEGLMQAPNQRYIFRNEVRKKSFGGAGGEERRLSGPRNVSSPSPAYFLVR